MKDIHFFDVDHTITAASTAVHYLYLGILRRMFPVRPLLSVPALLLKYKGGHFTVDSVYKDGIPFLVGKTRAALEELAVLNFRKRLKQRIFSDALKLIRELQRKGKRVVLATSSIDIVLAPLKSFLGVDEMVCSSLSFKNGICTGRFAGAPAFQDEKKRRVLAYMQSNNINPSDCYFYSDSIHDLPLLLSVGHPVAVNPDKRLNSEALLRNWEILEFSDRLRR